MSSTQDTSTYQFSYSYADPNYSEGFSFQLTEQPGLGDAEAFAIFDAIRAALSAPGVFVPNVGLFKSRSVLTNYDTNPSATPPSFT